MKMRPQPSLRRVLDDLGATLLEVVCGDAAAVDERSAGAATHAPVDEPVLPRRALVLGVGIRSAQEAAELLAVLGKHEAAGLVLRSPAPMSAEGTAPRAA